MSLNKTNIEWTDFSWNPVTGCKHGCSYCYARAIANRFYGTKAWPNGFEPTFHPERLNDFLRTKGNGAMEYTKYHNKKVFVCSMGDLFGDFIQDAWIQQVLDTVVDMSELYPTMVFQFLTKNPKRYKEFSFPKNCWLGTTVESETQAHRIDELLEAVGGSNITFVSFEPLLGEIHHPLEGIDWIIIGAMTGPGAIPPTSPMVESLLSTARLTDIPVFMKDNLGWGNPLREFPMRPKGGDHL